MAPDIRDYQQLVFGGATRAVDCAAWSGAIDTDAHTRGTIKLTGRQIRLASDEPVPDVGSPGLNVQQVDEAIYKLTSGRVNMWTPTPGSIGRAGVRDAVVDGRWVHIAVKRGVLVDRGYGGSSGFRGSHAITLHIRSTDLAPIIGDPLVPYYYAASWDAVFDAAQAVTNTGYIYCSFTRDLTADYTFRVPADRRYLQYYVTAGRITKRIRRYTENGFSGTCTPPRMHTGVYTRELVQITSGAHEGRWISSYYAEKA